MTPGQRAALVEIAKIIAMARSQSDEEMREMAIDEALKRLIRVLRERQRAGWWQRLRNWFKRLGRGR